MHTFEDELVALLAEAEASLDQLMIPRHLERLAISVEEKARLAQRVAGRRADAALQARAATVAGALRARLERDQERGGGKAIADAHAALHALSPDDWRGRLEATAALLDVDGPQRDAARALRRAVRVEVLTMLADGSDAGTLPAATLRRAFRKALDDITPTDEVPRALLERALRHQAELDIKLGGVVAATPAVRQLASQLRRWGRASASAEVLEAHAARLRRRETNATSVSASRAAPAPPDAPDDKRATALLAVEADLVLGRTDVRSSDEVRALIARIRSSRV